MKIIKYLFLSIFLVGPIATSATIIFNDTFSGGSTLNNLVPASPTFNSTCYQIISSKKWTPDPTIAPSDMEFGINSTISGTIEIEALFANSPATLTAVGDSIQMTVVFTNTSGLLTAPGSLGFGLYNSGQSQPIPGGLNASAVAGNVTAVTGGAQHWQGYVGHLSFSGGGSQIMTRASQSGTDNDNQDLITGGSQNYSYKTPPAVTIGSTNPSVLVFVAGGIYTETLQIILTGINTLAITNSLYSGFGAIGIPIDQFGGVASRTNFIAGSFDSLAIGWRETGQQPTIIDIASIQVADRTSNIPFPPAILSQPLSLSVTNGAYCTFSVTTYGNPAPNCQWFFKGQILPGATAPILNLNSVTAASSGDYFVAVSNPYGSLASATAFLNVLTDGANGNQPSQIAPSQTAPQKAVGVDSLILITHGFAFTPNANESWVSEMANAIQQRVPSNWTVMPYIWNGENWGTPDIALVAATVQGTIYGTALGELHYKHVHLIGHSAGAAFIDAAARAIRAASPSTIIHTTFLDPYVSLLEIGGYYYGTSSDWSDCYSAQDWTGIYTDGELLDAYNVDVSWLDPNGIITPYGFTGQNIAVSSHGWPVDFYMQSVTNSDASWCGSDYGFYLSEESAGWNDHLNYPIGFPPQVICGTSATVKSPNAIVAGLTSISLNVGNYAISGGVSLIDASGFILNTVAALPLASSDTSGIPQPADDGSDTNLVAWLASGVSVNESINFVQFEANFTDANGAQGLLSVYWNTNQVGMVDERIATVGFQTYRFALPDVVSNGMYTLSFRLDAFDNTSSSVAITNVATGFSGLQQPVTLNASLTNGSALLQLTAPTNFTYLIQSSTNLVNWKPMTLIFNTNGTSEFLDSDAANSKAKFYRAAIPF